MCFTFKLYSKTVLSAILLSLLAFKGDTNEFLTVFAKINEDVLKNSRAYETLGDATATIGHRLMGSENGTKAEQYAADLLRSYGFLNVKFQSFEAQSWMRESVSLEIVPNKSDNFRAVPAVSLAHSPVEANIKGKIIDVGNGLEEDFEAIKEQIKGKVVLANIGLSNPKPGQKNLHRSEKTALAIKHGATGIITVNQVAGQVLLTGTASVTGSLISIPAINISKESGEEIRNWMKVDPDLHALVEVKNSSKKVRPRNVIATIKGETNEKIVIGGHLDSWDLATGASDNGLGSFTIIDIARTFKSLNIKPKRTIDFVLFMGEEQGLLGSKHYVKEAIRTQKIDNIKLMLNLDMTNNVSGMHSSGRDEMMPFFKAVGEQIKQIDNSFKNTVSSRAGLHSDHQPFMLEGIPTAAPAGSLGPKVGPCYHADCDRFDLIKKDEMINGVRFTAMYLYALANAPELPAVRLDSDKTRDLMIAQGLKKELIIGRDWKW
jgi:carboxypeptidase Q